MAQQGNSQLSSIFYINYNRLYFFFFSYRFVLAGAGGIEHEQLVELASKHFSGMCQPKYDEIPPYQLPCRYTGSEIRVRDDSIPLAHVAIAVEGLEEY